MDVLSKSLNGTDVSKNGVKGYSDEYPPITLLDVTNEEFKCRAKALSCHLRKKFGRDPDFYVRVPGRVNIIGEHIDYSGYGVLPSAIQQDILLAVSLSDLENNNSSSPFVHLTNMNDQYPDFKCPLNKLNIQKPPSWYDYFLSGIHGILHDLKDGVMKDGSQEKDFIRSMYVAVDGTVPPCAGLSSSSALVSAAALATSHALKLRLSKLVLAGLCARTERNVGTEGGGMDQAIAFLATDGCAKLIEFHPLRCRDVRLPKGAALVVAHSMATINKAAGSEYNTRVVECRLAAQIIAKHQNLDWHKIRNLGDLERAVSKDSTTLDTLRHASTLVESILHEKPYSKEEILEEFCISSDELINLSLSANTTHLSSFKLKQRAKHVYEEAMRVLEFENECLENAKRRESGGDSSEEDTMKKLGALMNASHSSLRELYECSHPRLDQLVEVCQKRCYGARLTGAGWGGCVVALTTESAANDFVEYLKENFYKAMKRFSNNGDYNSVVFRTNLESGAVIFDS